MEERIRILYAEDDPVIAELNRDMLEREGYVVDVVYNGEDAFSVEFRKKSDVQNGEIIYLTGMTDQEITDHFNSSNIIVFYTPKGMEIGFNYEEGWVTVTYEEYDEYLKVF